VKQLVSWIDNNENDKLIHFSQNKNECSKLAKKFANSSHRHKFAVFDKVYKTEYKMESVSKSPAISESKQINLSHWASTLSTGINLHDFNHCSVDLKKGIPFIFIPMDKIRTKNDVSEYIKTHIIEGLIQKLSRICRNKGDKFKILILNRIFDLNSSNSIIYDLFKNKKFKKKFKYFKIYKNIKLNTATSSFFKHLKLSNKAIVSDYDIDILNPGAQEIDSDLISYLKNLPNKLENQMLKSLPRSKAHIKATIKKGTTPISSE
jgi:hypothetical protein